MDRKLLLLHFLLLLECHLAFSLDVQHYATTCPGLYNKVFTMMEDFLKWEPEVGPAMIKIMFEDCFVGGCDASILLDDTPYRMSEKKVSRITNSSTHSRAYEMIDQIKEHLEVLCPQTVSCADTLVLAAHYTLILAWKIPYLRTTPPMGRKDSFKSWPDAVMTEIPSPQSDFYDLKLKFSSKGFTDRDMVALSGAHTVGFAKCQTVLERLYTDAHMDNSFALSLFNTCRVHPNKLIPLDWQTPKKFDNKYYINIRAKRGLLHSDEQLCTSTNTDDICFTYAYREYIFYQDFSSAFIKLGLLSPLSESNGTVRINCRTIANKAIASNGTKSSIPRIYLIIGFLLACLPLVGEGSWRIRGLPENSKIVATHTDCPGVLIWDVEAQPNRHAVLGAANSRSDLILTGHQDNAEFALAMCPTEPVVLSGGKDKSVVLWIIQDHITTSATDPATGKPTGSVGSIVKKSGDGSDKAADGHPSVGPRGIYQGHEDTVEDVTFCPSSAQEFCSAGDDSCLTLWDARVGTSPAVKVEKAHNADLHCVDWNPHDDNLILTGSADNSVRMFDRRNLTSNGVGSPVYKFEGHKAAVLCVQWSPDKSSLFGSSAEDGLLNIWDYDKVGKKSDRPTRAAAAPAGLFFQHARHRDKVVDFHWNAADPWTVVSVSDDCDSTGGGGTLQIWRMSDLIYRPGQRMKF